MKTIQFILSLMAVALFASCSADSDVLNELEDHNQLPGDEMVTLSLNLSAGTVATKSDNTTATDEEKKINSCEVIVLGQNGIILFDSSNEGSTVITNADGTASVELGTIKKQALTIYVAANLDEDDQALFHENHENPAGFTKTTKASALPKYNKVSVAKANCTKKINITVKQLTARIDYPQVNENWPGVDFRIESVSLQNAITNDSEPVIIAAESKCAYVYPSVNTTITVTGGYYEAKEEGANIYGRDYTFGPYEVKGKAGVNMAANNIYQLVMTVQQPEIGGNAPGALGLDWFIAGMLDGGDINGVAGLN